MALDGRVASLGLDVEPMNRRPVNLLGLARRRFSTAEYASIAGELRTS